MPKLCLVPTPIGNLEDITLRAIRMLKEADFILAEDTRVTKKLLNHLEINNQVYAFHSHNEHKVLNGIIEKIQTTELCVLVSDAGTPAISDPGFLLVRACIEANIKVECLPGPTAVIPALVGSGFPCDKFIFEGFLPHKKGRLTRLQNLKDSQRTAVLYESPHRLVKCLEQIIEIFGPEHEVCVVRELSKMFETYHKGTAAELKSYFDTTAPKGEIVIVIKETDESVVKEEKKRKGKYSKNREEEE